MGPPRRYHDERIGLIDVGPACRERFQLTGLIVVIDPIFTPGPVAIGKLETLAEQRMKRMDDLEGLFLKVGYGCS